MELVINIQIHKYINVRVLSPGYLDWHNFFQCLSNRRKCIVRANNDHYCTAAGPAMIYFCDHAGDNFCSSALTRRTYGLGHMGELSFVLNFRSKNLKDRTHDIRFHVHSKRRGLTNQMSTLPSFGVCNSNRETWVEFCYEPSITMCVGCQKLGHCEVPALTAYHGTMKSAP